MIVVIVLAVLLIAMMAILAYRLMIHALPTLLAFATAHLAHATGAGWIGAGIVGLIVGMLSFCILAVLFATARSPILRTTVALTFVVPAVAVGYVLTYGLTEGAIPSAIWRQALCLTVGALVGSSALARLVGAAASGGESASKPESDQNRPPR